MKFSLNESISILARTPAVLEALTHGLSDGWTNSVQETEAWSVNEILGHLISGEQTDWMVRVEIILSEDSGKVFEPFDRTDNFEEYRKESVTGLLRTFRENREANLLKLNEKRITEEDLSRLGCHPEFGEVTLSQLLASWVVHDLAHIAQIARVMSKQYKEECGPWVKYLGILNM